MIPVPFSRLQCCALALLFSTVIADRGMAKTTRPSADQGMAAESTGQAGNAANLAAQVAEIARSPAISKAKKEKRISTAVRIAIVSATAYKNSPEEVLGIALELAEAAAAAAPHFTEVIANAISFSPTLAHVDGATGQIRSAAFSAAKNPKTARKKTIATTRPHQAEKPARKSSRPAAPQVEASAPAEDVPEPEAPSSRYIADTPMSDEPQRALKIPFENNSSFGVSADLSVSRDNNVFLTSTDKVSDTIIAVTPGVEFRFGQNSLTHGSVSYKNAITRYAGKSAPNVALSNAAADFGYDTGSLTILGNALFQQLNQNNSAVAGLGQSVIYRRDVLAVNSSVESHLTAKTSVKTGINYNKSNYKTGGLIGSQETEVPLKFYLETTPKVSLSAGVGFRRVTPENGGVNSSKDLDYNIGARGSFTAKLSGEFSLDYRTRSVSGNPKENLWGFNGTLNYEVTPKTTSSLAFSNDFNTGARGESLKNSSYALRLSSDLTPQWQLGAGLAFRRIEYGPTVFRLNIPSVDRTDSLWEGDLQASYLFRSWLSMSANYTLRRNHSSLPLSAADYSDSIISLIVGWRY